MSKPERSLDEMAKSLGRRLQGVFDRYDSLTKKMATTLAVCHGLLDEAKVKSSDVDMLWVFDDIEESLSEARALIGAEIPQLPMEVDEEGNEKIIRPF